MEIYSRDLRKRSNGNSFEIDIPFPFKFDKQMLLSACNIKRDGEEYSVIDKEKVYDPGVYKIYTNDETGKVFIKDSPDIQYPALKLYHYFRKQDLKTCVGDRYLKNELSVFNMDLSSLKQLYPPNTDLPQFPEFILTLEKCRDIAIKDEEEKKPKTASQSCQTTDESFIAAMKKFQMSMESFEKTVSFINNMKKLLQIEEARNKALVRKLKDAEDHIDLLQSKLDSFGQQ